MAEKTTRCGRCRSEFTDEEIVDATECPACGSQSVPQLIAHDLTLTLNWQDLRCLFNWAEEHVLASDFSPDSDYYWESLKKRVRKLQPEGAPGLTLRDEIQELNDEGTDAFLYHPRPQEGREP